MKTCSKCGEVKTLDAFYRDKNRLDGLHPHCKTCTSRARKEHYAANSTTVRARVGAWAQANQEKVRTRKSRYYEEHGEEIRARASAWAKQYPERMQENAKRWRAAHPEQNKAIQRRRQNRQTAELADRYLRGFLRRGTSLKPSDVPREIVEMKREALSLRRLAKSLKQVVDDAKEQA